MSCPVLFIVGPTASGKSSIALQVAEKLKGEIISADSMQVYRGMDIGTAKPSPQDQKRVPHHLIDILDPVAEYSSYAFCTDTLSKLIAIRDRGHVPVIVGGTGFYIRSLLSGLPPPMENTKGVREKYETLVSKSGLEAVYQKLKAIDPERARRIHPHDQKRIVRALEIFEILGQLPSSIDIKNSGLKEYGFSPLLLGIRLDRSDLYQRIDSRVQKMFDQGFLEEARSLSKTPLSKTASLALGYREIYQFLRASSPIRLSALIDQIRVHTRHFAKRQLTWFNREPDLKWIEEKSETALLRAILNAYEERKKSA